MAVYAHTALVGGPYHDDKGGHSPLRLLFTLLAFLDIQILRTHAIRRNLFFPSIAERLPFKSKLRIASLKTLCLPLLFPELHDNIFLLLSSHPMPERRWPSARCVRIMGMQTMEPHVVITLLGEPGFVRQFKTANYFASQTCTG